MKVVGIVKGNKKHAALMTNEEVRAEFQFLIQEVEFELGTSLGALKDYLFVDSDFFTAPASKSYHLSIAGGLAKHSLLTYRETAKVLDSQIAVSEEVLSWKVILAALCHDFTKVNEYVKGHKWVKGSDNKWLEVPTYVDSSAKEYDLGHASESAIILTKLLPEIDEEVLCAIMSHMGQFNEKDGHGFQRLMNSYRQTPLALALHTGDMLASYFVENKYGNDILEKFGNGDTNFCYSGIEANKLNGDYALVHKNSESGLDFTLWKIYKIIDGVVKDDNDVVIGTFEDIEFLKLFGLTFTKQPDKDGE